MGEVAKRLAVVGALVLGGAEPLEAVAAEQSRGARPEDARICPATAGRSMVVCFGDGALEPAEQMAVEEKIRHQLNELAREGLRLSGAQQLLVKVDGTRPNLVFHIEPVGSDGATLPGWEKTLARCDTNRGCTDEEWPSKVLRVGMREALIELRRTNRSFRADPAPSETRRYRPTAVGIAGIVTASVGGFGLLTGMGLMIAGGLRDIPTSGYRQNRVLLPVSRDFYTPGGVTLGASAAVFSAGTAMIIVDIRRWKAREGRARTSMGGARLQMTAMPWGQGVRVAGRF